MEDADAVLATSISKVANARFLIGTVLPSAVRAQKPVPLDARNRLREAHPEQARCRAPQPGLLTNLLTTPLKSSHSGPKVAAATDFAPPTQRRRKHDVPSRQSISAAVAPST